VTIFGSMRFEDLGLVFGSFDFS